MKEDDDDIDLDLIQEGLWDHYSELPNPAWYEFREKYLCKKCEERLVKSNKKCICES
jgi:hypothetical protein